jgi:predicted DNA binding protein
LDELLVSMGMERYADNIRRTLAAAPPLTDEQRRILREAMHGRPTASGTS